MNIGTVQSQVQLQMLDAKWKKKKKDISEKNTQNLSADELMMKRYEEQAEDVRKGKSTEQIYTKLKTGGTLTAEEIAYLKEHDPEALADYEQAQAEKAAYEKALKNCKTKEDVERLKMNRMGTFAAQVKSIANDPYIPEDKKLKLMNKINNEVCVIRDAHQEFVKSRAYEEMPREAELAEERAEETAKENAEALEILEETAAEAKEKTQVDEAKPAEDSEKKSEAKPAGEPEKKSEAKPTEEPEKRSEAKSAQDSAVKSQEAPAKQNVAQSEEPPSFEKISQDIERYLKNHGTKKSRFVAKA